MALRSTPLFATDRTAAQLLDMKPDEFLALVEKGHLPPPCDIGGMKRWVVADLERIASGAGIEEGIRW